MNPIQARPRQLAGLVLLLWVASLLLVTRRPGLLSSRHQYQVTAEMLWSREVNPPLCRTGVGTCAGTGRLTAPPARLTSPHLWPC